jgi:hypothetical protein
LLVRDCKGKEADTLVDLGVVSLVAERRGHERQAAEELGQWKTRPRRLPWPCSQGVGRAGPGDHGLLTGSRATGSTLPPPSPSKSPAATRATRRSKSWDRLRSGLDLILQQRGADMADVPGGGSGLLVRDYKGKEADRLVTRIDPSVVSLVAYLRGHERQAAEELEQRKTPSSSAGRSTPRRCVHHPSPPSMHPWPSAALGTPGRSADGPPAARIPNREATGWHIVQACHRRRAARIPWYSISP